MTGRIHDLGYQRYVGARRSPSTRWQVITRHELANAWKTWWRYKLVVAFIVIATFVFGGVMYWGTGVASKVALLRGGVIATVDAALPQSMEFYCRIAFYASLTIGAATIAGDLQTGAFTFYFARSGRSTASATGDVTVHVAPAAASASASFCASAFTATASSLSRPRASQRSPIDPTKRTRPWCMMIA